MTATVSSDVTAVQATGLAARVFGVLLSPRDTYAAVARRPRWLGVLVVVLTATILPTVVLLSTDVGQRAVLDQQLQTIEAFGRTVTDGQYAQIARMAPYSAYFAAGGQLVGLPLTLLLVSG